MVATDIEEAKEMAKVGGSVWLATLLPEGFSIGKGRDILRFWLGSEGLGSALSFLWLSASEEDGRAVAYHRKNPVPPRSPGLLLLPY